MACAGTLLASVICVALRGPPGDDSEKRAMRKKPNVIPFVWLGLGFIGGGIAAAIKPKEAEAVLQAANQLKIDRALFSAAVIYMPAGAAREFMLALPQEGT